MENIVELFSRHYDATTGALWNALKLALPALAHATPTGFDEERMRATFTTPMSLTSWGQNLTAAIDPEPQGGSIIRVYGLPRSNFMSTAWGEEVHAHKIEHEFMNAFDKALATGKTPIEDIELFSHPYTLAPEVLWHALKRALATMNSATVTDIDDQHMRAAFTTTWSLTSWGHNLHAIIEASGPGSSLLRVYGVPRSYIFSTQWGEELHASKVEHDLTRALEQTLA